MRRRRGTSRLQQMLKPHFFCLVSFFLAEFLHGGWVQPKFVILCAKQIQQRGARGRYPTNPPLFEQKKQVFVGPNTLLSAPFNQFSAPLGVQHSCTFLTVTFSMVAPPLMTS